MPQPTDIELSPDDIAAIARMAYGENAGEDNDTVKMTIQTALNRLRSGKTKEFGGDIPTVLKKGYYAVSKNSPLYQQAVSGKFPDVKSKARAAEIQKLTEAVVGDKDYGEGMFYFTSDEEKKLRKTPKAFNFKAVKPKGKVGKYNVYAY